MTLFHDTARAFSNCGTRVIAARDCVEIRLTPVTPRTRTIIPVRFILPSDLRDPPAPPDLPDLPFQSEEGTMKRTVMIVLVLVVSGFSRISTQSRAAMTRVPQFE